MDQDQLLVHRIINGDKSSFHDLVENYKRLVAHIVYTNVKNPHDREDISQEVFLKVYVNLSTFRFKCKLSTWIGKIAYNSCLNYFNKNKIRMENHPSKAGYFDEPEDTIEQIQSSEGSPYQSVHKKEVSRMVEQKIQLLPEKYQTVITLFHMDGLSYREISEILNISVDNIKVILYRSRRMLREKILEEHGKGELCP